MSETLLTTIPFDDAEQEAIVAHCLTNETFYAQVRKGLKPDDYTSAFVTLVAEAVEKFFARFERLPTFEEIQREHAFTHAELGTRKRMLEILSRTDIRLKSFGLDLIKRDVERWLKAKVVLNEVQKFARLYNLSNKDPEKLDEALSVLEMASTSIEAASFQDGSAPTFTSSSDRFDESQKFIETRVFQPYGVDFLDDATGGFHQNELILLGAKTGAGKTQLAAAVSLFNAMKGRRVHFMALEAEPYEIENRLKFSIYSQAFFAQKRADGVQVAHGHVTYSRYMQRLLEKDFAPFHAKVKGQFTQAFPNLHTLYRGSGTFDLRSLNMAIKTALREGAEMIVIDHIHYVDIDGNNENIEYKRVIKTLRDCVLTNGVPIVIVAHLRKTQSFRERALVPNLDDFHGTSELTKIATTCILLGRAPRLMNTPNYFAPTYIRIAKRRLDGSSAFWTGRCNFDLRTSLYAPAYELGMLTSGDTEFEETKADDLPRWAGKAIRHGEQPAA